MAKLEQRIDAQLGVQPTKLDWLVYRLFRWWWQPLLRKEPELLTQLERRYLQHQLENYRFATPDAALPATADTTHVKDRCA